MCRLLASLALPVFSCLFNVECVLCVAKWLLRAVLELVAVLSTSDSALPRGVGLESAASTAVVYVPSCLEVSLVGCTYV